MPLVRRLPREPPVASSTSFRPESASTTSMSVQSFSAVAFTRTFALAPTPRLGPESFQSTMKWSMNCSWLPSTSRYS